MKTKTNIRLARRNRRRKHVRKHMSGTAAKPRLTVFRSSRNIYAQLIDDEQGVTLASASSKVAALGEQLAAAKNPVDKSFIVGKALAESALNNKITCCVFDRAGFKYWGRVKALADGARDGGLKF
jgi:large subunit ribosomal protein L18